MKRLLRFTRRLIWAIVLTAFGRYLMRSFRELEQEAWRRDLKSRMKKCGNHVLLGWPVTLHSPEQIELGEHVHLAEYVHIWGSGGVRIGTRVMIGSHTAISSVTHDYTRE